MFSYRYNLYNSSCGRYATDMERAKGRAWGSRGAPTMRLFDDTYIAPMMGCDGGAAQYYRCAASGPHLHGIRCVSNLFILLLQTVATVNVTTVDVYYFFLMLCRRPTLFLHARNDPIVQFNGVRTDDFKFRTDSQVCLADSSWFTIVLSCSMNLCVP